MIAKENIFYELGFKLPISILYVYVIASLILSQPDKTTY